MKKAFLLYFFVLIVFQFEAIGENYYEFLDISPEASQEEITMAFRRFAQKWHPDKNDNPQSSEMFKKAVNIYEIFSDPSKKRVYDLSIKESLSERISKEENFETGDILSIEEFLAKYPTPKMRTTAVSKITNLKQLEIIMTYPDYQVRRAVVERAREIPKGMKIIGYLSNDPEVSVRIAVVLSIGNMKYDYDNIINKNIIEWQIDQFMEDPSSVVKQYLISRLAYIYNTFGNPEKALMRFSILMRDPEPKVRREVAENIGNLQNKKEEIIKILNQLKNDPESEVKKGVITGAIALGGSGAEKILDHFMTDPDPNIRVRVVDGVVRFFGGIRIKSAVKRLKVLMRDPDSEVRSAVAESAGKMRSEKAIEILNHLQNDPESKVKKGVITGAIELTNEGIIDYFMKILKMDVGIVKKSVEFKAEKILDHFMTDPDPNIRVHIVDSVVGYFGDIRIKSAVKRLKVLMRDPDSKVRSAVAESAGRMIGEERATREILYTLSEDRNSEVVDQTLQSAVSSEGKKGMNFTYRVLKRSKKIDFKNNQQLNPKERIEEALELGGYSAEEILDHFMKNPDPSIRVHIAKRIVGYSGKIKSAVKRLKVLMRDPDSKVRRATAENIGYFQNKKEEIIKILNQLKNDPESEVKKGVITGAIELGGSGAEKILDHFMTDPDPNIRVHIVDGVFRFFGGIRIKSAVKRLKVLMNDLDSEVRRVVAESAGRMRSEKESAIEILNYLKHDPSSTVQKGVITGAIVLGGSGVEEILDHFMKDPSPTVQKDVITGAVEVRGSQNLRKIHNRFIKGFDPSIRVHIAKRIVGYSGKIKIKSAVKRLKVLMRDPDSKVRRAVAESAGRMRSEKAIKILNYLKHDPESEVKKGVITGAIALGGSGAEKILDHFMTDPDPNIRVHIVDSVDGPFGDIKIKSAVKRLKVLMNDLDSEVRSAVAKSAGRMRSEKESAIEILTRMGNDSDFSIVVEVVKSSLSLGRETALTVLTSILLNNKNPQVQEYIGPIVREHLGGKTYQKLLDDNSCALSLSVN